MFQLPISIFAWLALIKKIRKTNVNAHFCVIDYCFKWSITFPCVWSWSDSSFFICNLEKLKYFVVEHASRIFLGSSIAWSSTTIWTWFKHDEPIAAIIPWIVTHSNSSSPFLMTYVSTYPLYLMSNKYNYKVHKFRFDSTMQPIEVISNIDTHINCSQFGSLVSTLTVCCKIPSHLYLSSRFQENR